MLAAEGTGVAGDAPLVRLKTLPFDVASVLVRHDELPFGPGLPDDGCAAGGQVAREGPATCSIGAQLAHRGACALSEAGIPTAPVCSKYEEWPRGRVLFDRAARRLVIRADRPEFLCLIADRSRIAASGAAILSDDHYQSVRHVPVSSTRGGAIP